MDILFITGLFGGLALFLYGMTVMSSGLEKSSGGKLEKVIGKITGSPVKSLTLGIAVTVAIQSSSALTVMLVGLVNSGIMQFSQTVGVIMGSNIGTTLTTWVLALSGIDSDNIFMKLLKPENFSPLFALVGIGMIMLSKKTKLRDIGQILIGFAILMYGMTLMSSSVEPLGETEGFRNLLTAFDNPILGVLVGLVFTGIIQSSAASVGILQALSLTGTISFGMAIPIIMGQNIGTCVTSAISSIGVNKNAKKVAVFHALFNVIGTVICMIIYFVLRNILNLAFIGQAITPFYIAIIHSIFNVFTTLVLFPFSKILAKFTEKLVGKDASEKNTLIDERLLNTPSIAISECEHATSDMAQIAYDSFAQAFSLFDKYDGKVRDSLLEKEDRLDKYEDRLGTVLVNISSKSLSVQDSRRVSKLLHCIGDFERIGDHAVNMTQVADEINTKGIAFSEQAQSEIAVLRRAICDILALTVKAFVDNDLTLSSNVEPFEQVIDGLIAQIKINHINRLQQGDCTIELGFVLSDFLTNCERVSDHCSNIAVAVIEVSQNTFDTHEYLGEIKNMSNPEFKEKFDRYFSEYSLPASK